MKVIFEETKGEVVEKGRVSDVGRHFKLYGPSDEDPYYLPFLLLQEARVVADRSWSIIQAKDKADAIRKVIKLIDAQAVAA